MKQFLTLKHWQLFLLQMGLPILLQLGILSAVFSGESPDLVLYLIPLSMIVFVAVFFGWLYALGTFLHAKLPASTPMNLGLFKTFLLIPAVYILLLSVFLTGKFNHLESGSMMEPGSMGVIIPLHLVSIFCIFYCLYFTAKAWKAVEWQKPVSFGDFAGEFCLFWLFPIGVWVLQPRINRLVQAE